MTTAALENSSAFRLSERAIAAEVLAPDYLDPATESFSNQCKAVLAKLAYSVSLVASIPLYAIGVISLTINLSIAAGAITVVTMSAVLTSSIPISLLYMLLGTILSYTSVALGTIGEQYQNEANRFSQIQENFQQIENHTVHEMRALLTRHEVDFTKIPSSIDISSKSFKCLFAAYLHTLEQMERKRKETLDHIDFPSSLADNTLLEQTLRYYEVRHNIRESTLWVGKIRAAVLLQSMYKPETKTLFSIQSMSFAERQASRLHLGDRSPYCVFNDSRMPLYASEMDRLTVSQVHQRMFPRA